MLQAWMCCRRANSGRSLPGGGSPPALPIEAIAANTRAHIATALHAIFERISATGIVPDSWRRAVLVPIYKKGDKADISNYRPLSASPPVACRVWSSLVNKKLMAQTDDVLPDTIFGFRAGRACTAPLFILRHHAQAHARQAEVVCCGVH